MMEFNVLNRKLLEDVPQLAASLSHCSRDNQDLGAYFYFLEGAWFLPQNWNPCQWLSLSSSATAHPSPLQHRFNSKFCHLKWSLLRYLLAGRQGECVCGSVMQTPGGIFSQFLKDFEKFPRAQLDSSRSLSRGVRSQTRSEAPPNSQPHGLEMTLFSAWTGRFPGFVGLLQTCVTTELLCG